MAGHHNLDGETGLRAKAALDRIVSIFKKFNVSYCLEGGTLLGIIREGRLLPWDTDIDLTITESALTDLEPVLKEIAKSGFKVRKRYHFADNGPLKKGNIRVVRIISRRFFFWRGDVRIDLFVKYTDGEKYYWTVGSEKNYVVKSVAANYFDELKEFNSEDKVYSVPYDYDAYLTCRYGEWKTPVKSWNCLTDDKAIDEK